MGKGSIITVEGPEGPPGPPGPAGADGRGIASVDIANGRLIVTYTDGVTHDAGALSAPAPVIKPWVHSPNATELGVYIGNNSADVAPFESFLGHEVAGVLAYTGEHGWEDADPAWQCELPEFLGGTPRRKHWSIPNFVGPDFLTSMREVASGKHVATHAAWANTLVNHEVGDYDIYVRTCWELGGEWFPWTQPAKDDPVAFKSAFARFSESFKSVSPRFKMVFDFVPDRGPVEQWYPGNAFVDVISQDVYWKPQWDGPDPVAAFEKACKHERGLDWVTQFANLQGKRIAISEWGVPGSGNYDGAAYIDFIADWMAVNKVVYADYWNSTSAYDGLLSDGTPPDTARALRDLFHAGVPW